MGFDDIVVGSGLSALGTVLGLLNRRRRVLCLSGEGADDEESSGLTTYPNTNVPREYAGAGGLGRFWHGVIPLAMSTGFPELREADVRGLLFRFYPHLDQELIGSDRLFIPFRPIRPQQHLARLAAQDAGLTLRHARAERVESTSQGSICHSRTGEERASRIWLCCGTMGTPRLLERSGLISRKTRSVSDHVIGYAGLVQRDDAGDAVQGHILRNRSGIMVPCQYSADRSVLYMLRPARFDFARLDEGIEKRAVFGLPTSRLLAGLAGRLSPGLIAEALFNKLGLFPSAQDYSVNFITRAPEIDRVNMSGEPAPPSVAVARAAVEHAMNSAPFSNMRMTRRPDLFIPGVHLHGSLNAEEAKSFRSPSSAIRVADASIQGDIGPEHHSFKMMASAYAAAKAN